MVISTQHEVGNRDFEQLMSVTTRRLQELSSKENERYLSLLGNKLEDEVYAVMCACAENTPFEGTIDLISGQKFPDIIANNYYGVEVKSTKQDHWRTTGNSILETTRVDEIERIYMLFGKIHNPIEFRCRLYQDCLSDVVVTHSPRYAIDMNTAAGATIFDKIASSYDEVRQLTNPVAPFKEYYRGKLKEGQELWWIDKEEYAADSIYFKTWNSLSLHEKRTYKLKGYAYFPEVLDKTQTKFDKFSMWLSVRQRIICPNVRDIFTAGGRGAFTVGASTLNLVPQALVWFMENIEDVIRILNHTPTDEINEIWKTDFKTKEQISGEWIARICTTASTIFNFQSFDIEGWLKEKLKHTH